MRYNEQAYIVKISNIDDGMGGVTEEYETVQEIKCRVLPYTIRTVNDAGIPTTFSQNRLLTRDKIDSDLLHSEFLIQYKDVIYKKNSATDYNKCIVIEMELK